MQDTIEALRAAMLENGISCQTEIIPDDELHRFKPEDRNNPDAWYVLHLDGIPAGSYGDWKTGASFTWCEKNQSEMTQPERAEYTRHIEAQKQRRDAEQKKIHGKARQEALKIWEAASPATQEHPYLKRKQVQPYGVKVDEQGRLVVPARDADGKIHTIERITPDGEKRFLKNGAKQGFFFEIPGSTETVYICEGFSTSASIHQATGRHTVCSFDCGNLKPVAAAIRKKYPNSKIVIAADNDQTKPGNPGLTAARAAAKATGAEVAVPEFKKGKAKLSDFNDLATEEGVEEVKRQLEKSAKGPDVPKGYNASELMDIVFPEIKWAIPDILPEGLNILGGKPKQGKSIFALNTGIAVSSGGKALGKIDVEMGSVIYLALEDTPRRLQQRLRQMLRHGGKASNKLHLFTEWPRADKGGLELLETEIKKHGDTRLVIIDTLAKFRPTDRGANKSLYDVDYQHVAEIKSLADRYTVTILLIHHLRKMEADDIMDTFSGSLGLTGAADGLLALARKTGQADAVLHINGRDVEAAEFALKFDPEFMSWQLLGDAGEVQDTQKQQALFDALKDAEEALTPKELSEITGLNYKYITKTLPKLLKLNAISKIERGKYIYMVEGLGGLGGKGDIGGLGGKRQYSFDSPRLTPWGVKGRGISKASNDNGLQLKTPIIPIVPYTPNEVTI
ncbi:MAG: AAA family ATPase [Desulfobacterales bacterium]|nr:AAA family ATPase [Desulfobacterales bacterium]MDD4070839.1 AAA family ATPase [Desulfobacterales bacterium]MDD4391241.1 AAA family ATPase [Desulfobacterales bacterium]